MKFQKIRCTVCGILACLILSSCALIRPATRFPADTDDSQTNPVTTEEENTTALPDETTSLPADSIQAEQPAPTPEYRVSFIGAGDNIIYYGNVRDAASCAQADGRTYNFQPIYSDVATLVESADVAFINQETLMCGDGYAFSYYPRFNGPQDLGYDLAEIGFDVVNIANNHMLDKGSDGLAATIDFWNSMEGITLIGGYCDEDDYENIRTVTSSDICIAFLSYTFTTNGLTLPSSSALVVPYPEDDTVISQLARANEIADYVIVSVHWGDENTFTPNSEQRSFAELLAENGADAIIGHHPHVIQPIEWIEREDGTRTLCVYSLGNFVAEMARDYNMLGGLISFDIVKHGEQVYTENVEFIPTVYYFTTSFYQNHVYPMTDFTDALAETHGLAYYGRSLSLTTLKRYLNETIADEFLAAPLRSVREEVEISS